MARNLSAAARQAIYAAQTGEAFIVLLTLSHTSLPAPIRVGSAGEDVTSRGNIYQAFPFRAVLGHELDDAPRAVTLQIDNVDRRIVEAIRPLSGDITVILEVVMASTPDTVEVGPYYLSLRDVSYDAVVVEGQLQHEDILNEPFPADTFDPSRYPGVFRGNPIN